ncbi:type II secretion system protein [Motilibacter deserti]|uniref:Flp pilus-assembly TadG-like N-terminal domain-containing protein n=1 Tax=Motilibacter deserti TaxID=2714956 RepID=A0ABX0GWK3_9ACTN|nr:hypothetical protein [Motilibacter deserti]NHC14009.1 hypothetical protein [Motilibacter deserti]
MRPRLLSRARRADDSGFTLVTVTVSMVVLFLLLSAAMVVVVNDLGPERRNQSDLSAVAAAQAGVDEFTSRLNVNSNYYRDDEIAKTTNAALATAAQMSSKTFLGAPVPGTGTSGGYFKYRLLSSTADTTKNGIIRLQVTGTSASGSGGRSHTLTVEYRRNPLLNYLWNTQYEALYPGAYKNSASAVVDGAPSTNRTSYRADPRMVEELCAARYFTPRGSSQIGRANVRYTSGVQTTLTSGERYTPYYLVNNVVSYDQRTITGLCASGEPEWTTGDVVDGPLHSNDALKIGGTVAFLNRIVETGWSSTASPAPSSTSRLWYGNSAPLTQYAGRPAFSPYYAPDIELPGTNEKLRQSAGTDGCVYTGETTVVFNRTTMSVYSPNTRTTKAGCFNAASANTAQTYPIPSVVYVDASGSTGCTNAWARPAGMDTGVQTNDYSCTQGDVFVQGTVAGQVTVAAANDIVVTGDLKYDSGITGTDVIGLVANSFVWVYHPVDGGSNMLTSANSVHYIDAAVTALNRSFSVENWSAGAGMSTSANDATKLNVRGVIVQKFRGAVGTGGGASGYLKNYSYDARLANQPPPYYSRPEATSWDPTLVSEG